jgi:hypothetical protein
LKVWHRLLSFPLSATIQDWLAAVSNAGRNLHLTMVHMGLADDIGSDSGSFEVSGWRDNGDTSESDSHNDARFFPSQTTSEVIRTSRKRRGSASTGSKKHKAIKAAVIEPSLCSGVSRHDHSMTFSTPPPSTRLAIDDSESAEHLHLPEVRQNDVQRVTKF